MIFADKLILLRKKAGWSQEELADQMNVTRQSVSKWEGAQSVPDLEKMLRLSELFGVSTDYLLKDEIEEAEHIDLFDDTPLLRRVSMEEANAFLSVKLRTAKTIAYAAFLCIVSPIALLTLSAISESTAGVLNENIANGIGMIVLIILVAIAAVMFISSGSKTAPFAYLEKEKFETEYGVSGMVKERKAQYKDLHTKHNIVGTCLCVTALIPLFIGAIINDDSDLFLIIMLSLSFLIAGVGVICFIKTGIIWASYEKLLQEGEYSKENKEKPSLSSAIYTAYWVIAAAVYATAKDAITGIPAIATQSATHAAIKTADGNTTITDSEDFNQLLTFIEGIEVNTKEVKRGSWNDSEGNNKITFYRADNSMDSVISFTSDYSKIWIETNATLSFTYSVKAPAEVQKGLAAFLGNNS